MQIKHIPLNAIEQVNIDELKPNRIDILLNGAESFDTVINSRLNPITLDGPHAPYVIIDGRHRVYLSRQRGDTHIPARCLWLERRATSSTQELKSDNEIDVTK